MNLLLGLGSFFRLKISYTNLLYSMILVMWTASLTKLSVAYVLFLVFKDSAVKQPSSDQPSKIAELAFPVNLTTFKVQ